jgi:RNA polymerase sigma factor (sigma-70 family)
MANAHNGIVLRQIDRLYREGTLAGLGDHQLLERYLTRRDEAAFEALVNLHGPMVLGLCRRMLRDPRDVEDAFQATFLILVRKASAIRDPSHLSNWLYGVASRVAVRARTNTLRRRGRETTIASLEVATAPETMDLLEIGPVLDQELNRLPRKYRAVLVLCYLKARTHDQAAEELHCPVGTVRSRLARGRDLLKRRLTQRGHAPTSAILGTGTSLPAQFLTEAVPPSLVSATVQVALGFNSLKTIPAGAAAASALTLTQGVLTTMKLAQLKWIGLILCATSLSAGGVVAVSFAKAQISQGSTGSDLVAVEVDASPASGQEPEKKMPRLEPATGTTEDRLKALESKLDQLLSRSTATATPSASTTPSSNDPFRPAPASIRFDLDSRSSMDTTNRSIRELEVELKLALDNYDRTEKLFKMHAISAEEWDQVRGKVLLVAARLEGLDDDVTDELALLRLEIKKKAAELDRATAQREVASSVVARNRRLDERKPGMVDDLSVAKAEAEVKISSADMEIKRVEIAEVELRVDRIQRRRDRIRQVIKLAERAKATVDGQQSQPTKPGENAPR